MCELFYGALSIGKVSTLAYKGHQLVPNWCSKVGGGALRLGGSVGFRGLPWASVGFLGVPCGSVGFLRVL